MAAENRDIQGGTSKTLATENLAILCAQIADEKKAEDIVVLDLQGIASFTDYFVVCSGINKRQLQAIAAEIEKQTDALNIKRLSMEGYNDARWILLDYGGVIIHLFDKDARSFYDLELLWGDAAGIKWQGKQLELSQKSSAG
ncbi:MAG: ribosome silencing factor [Planctomycetota bacterium]|jgi:ribosome-associated protein